MTSKIIYRGARIITFFIFFIGIKNGATAQTAKVWVSINSIDSLNLTIVNRQLHSNKPSVQRLISELHISSIQQALPMSKKAALLNVYELACACDENDLLQRVARLGEFFSNPTPAPKYEPLYSPNDYNISFTTDYALDLINAKGAWDITQGDPSVILTISDGNYDINHEDLTGKYSYVTPYNQNTNYSHGTAVAITAAGKTNNGLGKSSIGFNSKLELRAMSYSEVLTASNSGVKVINLSWTSGCYFNQYIQLLLDEVYENGTFVIASAGNGSTCGGPGNLVYPAAHNHVFAVSSIGPLNNHQQIIGNPNTTHQHNASVDLCAPGYDVPLSIGSGVYTTGNGTSFAAPFVTGTVGLMLAANPCLKPDDIEYILKTSAYDLSAANPTYVGMLGAGRLDAYNAVMMAKNYTALTITNKQFISCKDDKQTMIVDVAGGNSPYTIQWDNGFEGNELTGIAAGEVYGGTVTDNLGCVSVFQFVAETISSFSFSADIQHVKCYGRSTGSIDLTLIGGLPNYTFNWSTGETTQSIGNLTAGYYTVSIMDNNGCKLWADFLINEPPKLTASAIIKSQTKSIKGEIDITVSGGVPPYNYLWSNGETSEDISNLNTGNYLVDISDLNQCHLHANFPVNYSIYPVTVSTKDISAGSYSRNSSIYGTLDVTKNSTTPEVQIFPNPSSDRVTITWSEETAKPSSILIFDLNGKLVHSTSLQDVEAHSYEVSKLDAGVYTVEMRFGNEKIERKRITFI